MSDESEPLGQPTPLEIVGRDLTLHRSAMHVLMQGGSRPYSEVLVHHYLTRRPDMRERVDAWRRAGAAVLAKRKSAWQAEARQRELLEAAQKQAENREKARRLALSHVTGLTAQERFMMRLAERLLAAAAREPDRRQRIDLIGEAYALLVEDTIVNREGD